MAAEIFPLKLAPLKNVKLLELGFEKVLAASVPVNLALPVTSNSFDGAVLLIPTKVLFEAVFTLNKTPIASLSFFPKVNKYLPS